MRSVTRLGVAVLSIGAVLASAACSGGAGNARDAEPSSEMPIVTRTTPSPSASPLPDAYPSFPAGIPTVEPTPKSDAEASSDASFTPRLTIASPDPDSGGMIVGGFVSGIVEDGGRCEYLVIASDGKEFVAETAGVENVSTTSCGSTLIPVEAVPAGDYRVVLHYASERGDGRSEAVSVRMP